MDCEEVRIGELPMSHTCGGEKGNTERRAEGVKVEYRQECRGNIDTERGRKCGSGQETGRHSSPENTILKTVIQGG